VRRARGITESLLSIVLVLEAIVLFFVSLTAFGLRALPPAVALGGGLGLIAVFLIVSLLQRYRWGIAIGWVLQAVIICLGILVPLMYFVGAGFAAIWVYCYLKARQIEKQNRGALASPDQGGPA
jgi:hypothetical protein